MLNNSVLKNKLSLNKQLSLLKYCVCNNAELAEELAKIGKMEKEMKAAAKNMEFERAAEIRDRIKRLKDMDLVVGGKG